MYEIEKKMSILCNLTYNAKQYFKQQKNSWYLQINGWPKTVLWMVSVTLSTMAYSGKQIRTRKSIFQFLVTSTIWLFPKWHQRNPFWVDSTTSSWQSETLHGGAWYLDASCYTTCLIPTSIQNVYLWPVFKCLSPTSSRSFILNLHQLLEQMMGPSLMFSKMMAMGCCWRQNASQPCTH